MKTPPTTQTGPRDAFGPRASARFIVTLKPRTQGKTWAARRFYRDENPEHYPTRGYVVAGSAVYCVNAEGDLSHARDLSPDDIAQHLSGGHVTEVKSLAEITQTRNHHED